MSDLNIYTCTGRLGRDPEKRTFQNGDSVVNLNLAVSESWKSRDSGERQERTLWLNVTIQNQGIAKVAEQYLKKGSKVAISGKLQSREYEKDGQKHTVIDLVVSPFGGSLTLLDSRNEDSQPRHHQSQTSRSGGPSSAPAFDDSSDIPF